MRDPIDSYTFTLRAAVVCLTALALAGCAMVKINPDSTDSVEHGGGDGTGQQLANLACHKAGAVRAEIIETVKKDESAPQGKGRYVTTFRCLY
ncbi:MAG: hypothetical protein SXG53_13115 [Pseudomonadota bacterium]|nr:hypothetical protein [Pseudomonadota bacterium]